MGNSVLAQRATDTLQQLGWDRMVDYYADRFGMQQDERKQLRDNKAAQLVAALPLLANVDNAERTSWAHVGTFVLATRQTSVFAHQPGESIQHRLQPISGFAGGDSAVIERGMLLLEVMSLSDHNTDRALDVAQRKYNPLTAGNLDFESELARLTAVLDRSPDHAVAATDTIISVTDAIIVGFWQS